MAQYLGRTPRQCGWGHRSGDLTRRPGRGPNAHTRANARRQMDRERARRATGALYARAQYLGATAGSRTLALRPRAPGPAHAGTPQRQAQRHTDPTPPPLRRPRRAPGSSVPSPIPSQRARYPPPRRPPQHRPRLLGPYAASTGRGCVKWATRRRATTASVPMASRHEPLTRGTATPVARRPLSFPPSARPRGKPLGTPCLRGQSESAEASGSARLKTRF